MAEGRNGKTERITRADRAMQGQARADPLSAMAPLLRVRPFLDVLCRFGGQWASPHEAEKDGWAQFHIVTRGECQIDRTSEAAIRLKSGDVLLLPWGDPHIVRARRGISRDPAKIITEIRNAIRVRTVPDEAVETELICGRLHFEAASPSLVVAALPRAIVLRPADWPEAGRVRLLLEAIRDELDGDRNGAGAIATDLASALFVMMLRAYLERGGVSQGVLRLLSDRHTAKAVLAMLGAPAHDWTIEALAEQAASSRATLIRAFRAAAGMPPLAFLTDLRMGLARQSLVNSATPLAQIAADVGYQSESALSRAIQRHFGVRPGELRRTAQTPK